MILEHKILVFESLPSTHSLSNELERGGLQRDNMSIVSDYDLAMHVVTLYPIRAAVLHIPGLPKNAARNQELHKALRRPNPYVEIYHVVSFPLSSLEEMEKFGLVKLAVTGLLPAKFGSTVEENPLCQFGLYLHRKYFSEIARA
ncbi:MAG: hypothetical protein Q7K45_04210 [Nanoarchaeota archaeon]|nr:hypothetical protein [Nanoarchaeota archaeon]